MLFYSFLAHLSKEFCLATIPTSSVNIKSEMAVLNLNFNSGFCDSQKEKKTIHVLKL